MHKQTTFIEIDMISIFGLGLEFLNYIKVRLENCRVWAHLWLLNGSLIVLMDHNLIFKKIKLVLDETAS